MKTMSTPLEYTSTEAISSFARRNYNTYVKHYLSRNMTPMPLKEFLKNYIS